MNEKQQLDAELAEVLKHLPGWKLDPRYDNHCWCAVLIDGTGRGIHANATQAKGRLYLSGCWPSDSENRLHGPDKHLHITVARNRPPAKIAAEIQRRFLPWYLAEYAKHAERAAKCNTDRTRQQELAVELAALLGPEVKARTDGNPARIHAKGISVEVHGNGDVSLEVRYTTVKVAKALLKAYAKAGGLDESA